MGPARIRGAFDYGKKITKRAMLRVILDVFRPELGPIVSQVLSSDGRGAFSKTS